MAISPRRLRALVRAAGPVAFAHQDYGDGARPKTMTLDRPEFGRRLALHLLPERLVCPHCGAAALVLVKIIPRPSGRRPPWEDSS